ncbi:acetyl-CoA synthetase-like protein [Rickenella mellea]|uniref:Acetyl-CoA synthetase-like protein n=1 Tax=Rickenella mellea TaxID=50990 RepID=A0A4Y7QL40_9AGAM|nr:acetyl-CoA synthetase-like protein [Rickenella mellea]
MTSFTSHLTALQSSASRHPSAPAFQITTKSGCNGGSVAWVLISYHDFLRDVDLAAKYWSNTLSAIPTKAVVGMWLAGMDYSDVVHIYGISRAGYIPQLFSLRLPNPTVVAELLERARAQALIYDRTFESVVHEFPLRVHTACSLDDMSAFAPAYLPPLQDPVSKEELVFIFHTSGSTSGSPKLVRCNYVWLESMLSKSAQICIPQSPNRQDVCTWMGSMCHIAQSFMLMGAIQHGSCTIQPTRIDFSSEELADMISRCRLNRLHQFATFLTVHIRHARQNPKLLSVLRSLDTLLYSGLPLGSEEEEFGYSNSLPLRNLFGSTECGAMLISEGGSDRSARFLRPLNGVHYEFMPISPPTNASAHVSANSQLAEMVIMSDSPDCPDMALRQSSDGHFHTGDLFQEVSPGKYVSRGRNDDWIKSLNSLRCDTRSIEDNVRSTCGDLVQECVVVGTGRPSPTLFVEPATDMDHELLKREIVRRTRLFHSRRYLHERITSVDFIVVVKQKSLPRTATKGNIRRQAVEEAYKQELDEIYGVED